MDNKIATTEPEEFRVSDVDPFPEPGTMPRGWNTDAILQPSPGKLRASQPLPDWHEHLSDEGFYPKGWM